MPLVRRWVYGVFHCAVGVIPIEAFDELARASEEYSDRPSLVTFTRPGQPRLIQLAATRGCHALV
jgi:hypothetical protein